MIARLARPMMRPGIWTSLCGGLLAVSACHGVLDASDPTRVLDSDIANAAGANSRRLYVSFVFGRGFGSTVTDVALFSDETKIDGRGQAIHNDLNRRDGPQYEIDNTSVGHVSTQDPHLGTLDAIVTAADVAIPAIRANTPDSLKGDFLAHVFAMSGTAVVQMAEDVCSGFPINHVSAENNSVFGPPLTTDSALAYGVTQLDSALTYAHDSTQFRDLASVVKGRALLDRGQYAAAAAAVANVATSFEFRGEGNNFAYENPNRYDFGFDNIVTADSEGGNGLPFVSAHDPRVQNVNVGVSYFNAADSAYMTTKYTDYSDHIIIATGIEARLIEAEAALNAGDPSWLTTLNTLRESIGLTDLSDPGTTSAQVDMLFRERAFWLYLTGRRLGDLRRLVRNYGRDPNTVFPVGPALPSGQYGPSTAIPFVFATESVLNPYLTSGCTGP